MVNARFFPRLSHCGPPLVLVGTFLLLSTQIAGQSAPAVAPNAAAEPQLPAEVQAKLDNLQARLKAAHAAGDRNSEATALKEIGDLYLYVSAFPKALESYNQALPMLRAAGDRDGEAGTLNNMGIVYRNLGKPEQALESYSESLPIKRGMGDRDGEANTLQNIGVVYRDLGKPQQALDSYNQALLIYRAWGDRDGEALALTNLGKVYAKLGEKQKALDDYNQALPIFRQVGDRDQEANALMGIGQVESDLGSKDKALENCNQALSIYRAVGDRDAEADALMGIGQIYSAMANNEKALDYLNRAQGIATGVDDPMLEANILFDLMQNRKHDAPALAVFYGKQAVNLLQQVRVNIQGLDKELQQSFLASKSDYYHDLADLLIDQGRLPEAQQVLDLLKQQEYSDYTRGDPTNTLSLLTLTPAEKQAEDDYQASTAELVSLGEQWSALKKISARTPQQEQQFQQLSDQMKAASNGLNGYYARLYELLGGQNSGANKQVADVKGDVSLLEDEVADSPHTVALYTMVSGDRYRVIVITGSATVAREYAITSADLNKKISEFQQVLRSPDTDPRPLAQELYKILIGPVQADLDQARAETLVWSLDGVLRYVPMAALYDGNVYLVEKYNTVTITPASIAHLSEKPDVSHLSAVAMGISRQYESDLPQLPAVVAELDDVVKDAQVAGAHGVLPGSILLNNQFTETAMENELDGEHAVVHIASHFVFQPGDDSQSYLLLAGQTAGGAGYHLTVADFRDNQNLALRHTDLLTLSACDTGMSGDAGNGREVDGLGTTAQLKGARAVISSLWEVNDASTGQLMADFYRRWAEGGGKVMKVEALREAQLDLLQGGAKPAAGNDALSFGVGESKQQPPPEYAHPYYWAPFVLMGNWR